MPLNDEEKLLCFMFFSFLYGASLLEQTVAFFSPDWVVDNDHPPCESVGLFTARNCSYYDMNYLDNGNHWCRDIDCHIPSYYCGSTSYTYVMEHCRKTCNRCSESIAGRMFYPQLVSLLLNYVTTALLLGSIKFCRNDFLVATTGVFYGVVYPLSALLEASSAFYVVVWYHSGFASRLALASGSQSIILYILTRIYDCKYQKDAKKLDTKSSKIVRKKEMPTFKKWKIRNKWVHIKLDLDDIYTKAAKEENKIMS
ncbi:hypothetical protein CHS0354_033862 [Potamilus streckersoni]|uniref:ShKT domain-containing protein n=1 Tax=Potamilus streckersoni TaxID=2493646 RepID=A0AAE0RX45_9BIVA|nr:hypothetical protein CHS0354_033862 [Potamilus streckersoni]